MFIAQERTIQENMDYMLHAKKVHNDFSAESCLNVACETFPVIRNAINNYGDHTLSEYLNHIIPVAGSTYQSMTDLLEVVYTYTKPLLGEEIAKQVANDIEACPVVLTANHHGVAYFAQDFQGCLIFSLNRSTRQNSLNTVPVFSCGAVPLNNLTYPLGMLLYRVGNGELDAVPRKLPVFPNKYRRRLVSVVDCVDDDMIKRAQKRVDKLVHDRMICASLAEPVHKIFQNDYCAPSVITEPLYSRQAVVLNNRIWNRLFGETGAVPEIVSLELEKISSALLERDLANSESLVSCIMFDAKLRENVFEELDGSKACWQTKKLLMRLHADPLDKTELQKTNGCGTMLFWGIDDWGRRVPLYLKATTTSRDVLRGVDDRGNNWELPFSPESIKEGINQGKLLPSMFTSYLVVSLARGVVCTGGYFQCEYLPAMQRGIVAALKKTGGYDIVAKLVSNVPTNTYLSGMIAVMTRINSDYLVPAGPVEILAGGGICKDDIERLRSLTVRDAHIGALSDTMPDLPNWKAPTPTWKTHLAADIARLLENKIVIK